MTPPRKVDFPEALRAFVQAKAGAAHEQCGLLLGQMVDGCALIDEALAAPNNSTMPQDSFEIDPATRLKAQRTAREKGRAVLGLYHTHPKGVAQASKRDHTGAKDESGLVWVIASQTDCAIYLATEDGLIDSQTLRR